MDSKRKKVLILCNDFPPINSIGADRPYSWYKYFHEFNLYPIVITKNWSTNGNSPFNMSENYGRIDSHEKGTIIYTAKSNTLSLLFQTYFGQKLGILRKSLSYLEKILSFKFFIFDQHRAIFYEAEKYLKNHTVHAVITTGEPFILFKYGYLLKKKYNLNWIADYRDLWYLNHMTSINSGLLYKFMREWEFGFEKKYVPKAAIVTAVDTQMASRLNELLNVKVDVIYNGFWNYYEPIKNHSDKKNKAILNHTGTLTTGQNLELLLDAIIELFDEGKLTSDNFEFNLIGLEYFPNQIKRLEKYKNIMNKLIFTTPRLPKNQAIQRNLTADYLISFTDPNLSAIYAKTYDYIACRKPILVIPGDDNLLDNLIKKNKLGIILNNKKEIKEFLQNPRLEIDFNSDNLNFYKRKNQAVLLSNFILELEDN